MPGQHPEDRHSKLDQQPFSYQTTLGGRLLIFALSKLVMTLKGEKAKRLISKLNDAEDEKAVQLLLAKATGNYKRGNERSPLKTEMDGR